MPRFSTKLFPDAALALGRVLRRKEPPILIDEVKTHKLKIWPEFFRPLVQELKTFEIRKNDQGFLVGDILQLEEWNPQTEMYTGQTVWASISYLTTHAQLHGHVVMAVKVFRKVLKK